jgi:hypothetical protein
MVLNANFGAVYSRDRRLSALSGTRRCNRHGIESRSQVIAVVPVRGIGRTGMFWSCSPSDGEVGSHHRPT